MNLSDRNNITNAENAFCLAIAFSGAITTWWNHEAFAINTRDRICRRACSDVRIVSAIHSGNNVLFAANTWNVFSTREIPFHTISRLIFLRSLSEPEIEPAIINIADISTLPPLHSRVKNRPPVSEQTRDERKKKLVNSVRRALFHPRRIKGGREIGQDWRHSRNMRSYRAFSFDRARR